MDVKLSGAELQEYLEEVFPQIHRVFVVEHVAPMTVRMRMPIAEQHLRPGGTVSGPTMFGLADVTIYAAVLAMIGREALAVTTNCSIDFMRKPEAGKELIAEGRLLKLGRTLAVGDVLIWSEGAEAPVARASLTYSIPPKRVGSEG